jgi:CO/xanthine dehydrogenase FAD-binding subunit
MLYTSLYAPETVQEAVAILAEGSNGYRVKPIAGGTDLMIQLRERMVRVDTLVDLSTIPELQRIWVDDQRLHLGAAVTYSQLIESDLIQRHADLLAEASQLIGGPQIQHMGTIGGSLASASPTSDMLPCLAALNAEITLTSIDGDRHMPLSDFLLGSQKTILRPNELISRVSFKKPPPNAGSAFTKLGLRRSQAIAVVNAAVVLCVEDGQISQACVALGSVAPTVVRSPSSEQHLLGQVPSEALIEQAAEAAREHIDPISDIHCSRAYRLHTAKAIVKSALENALQRIRVGTNGKKDRDR